MYNPEGHPFLEASDALDTDTFARHHHQPFLSTPPTASSSDCFPQRPALTRRPATGPRLAQWPNAGGPQPFLAPIHTIPSPQPISEPPRPPDAAPSTPDAMASLLSTAPSPSESTPVAAESPNATTMFGPDPLLHPLLLEFGAAELEQEFIARSTAARIRSSDIRAVVGTVAFHSLYLVIQGGLFRDRLQTLYSATVLLFCCATYALATGRIPARCRTPLIVTVRLILDYCIAAGMVTWNEPNHVAGWSSLAKHVFLNTGVVSICYQSLAYPLPFKIHIPVQIASVLIFSRFMAPGCCPILLSHPTTTTLVSHTWAIIQWICRNGSFMGRIVILIPSALATISASSSLVCTASATFLQAMLGLVLPLVLLYSSERTERQHFWAGLHGYTPAEVAAAARVHPLTKFGCVYVLLFVGLCFWEGAFVLLHLSALQQPC